MAIRPQERKRKSEEEWLRKNAQRLAEEEAARTAEEIQQRGLAAQQSNLNRDTSRLRDGNALQKIGEFASRTASRFSNHLEETHGLTSGFGQGGRDRPRGPSRSQTDYPTEAGSSRPTPERSRGPFRPENLTDSSSPPSDFSPPTLIENAKQADSDQSNPSRFMARQQRFGNNRDQYGLIGAATIDLKDLGNVVGSGAARLAAGAGNWVGRTWHETGDKVRAAWNDDPELIRDFSDHTGFTWGSNNEHLARRERELQAIMNPERQGTATSPESVDPERQGTDTSEFAKDARQVAGRFLGGENLSGIDPNTEYTRSTARPSNLGGKEQLDAGESLPLRPLDQPVDTMQIGSESLKESREQQRYNKHRPEGFVGQFDERMTEQAAQHNNERHAARTKEIQQQFQGSMNQQGQVELPKEHTYESQQTFNKAFNAAMEGHHVDIAPMTNSQAHAYVSNIEYEGRRLNYTAEQKAQVLTNMGVPSWTTPDATEWEAVGNTVRPKFSSAVREQPQGQQNLTERQQRNQRMNQMFDHAEQNRQERREAASRSPGAFNQQQQEHPQADTLRLMGIDPTGMNLPDELSISDMNHISNAQRRQVQSEMDRIKELNKRQQDNLEFTFGNDPNRLRAAAYKYSQLRPAIVRALGKPDHQIPGTLSQAAYDLTMLEMINTYLTRFSDEKREYDGSGRWHRRFNPAPDPHTHDFYPNRQQTTQ